MLVLLTALLIGTSVAVVAVSQSRAFGCHLDRIEESLRKQGKSAEPRSDLPDEVRALAARIGAVGDGQCQFASFSQSGQMWRSPGGKAMNFTARQTMRIDAPGFLWRACFGSAGVVVVADYLAGKVGGLEARVLSLLRVANTVGGTDSYKGEALRYLAEIPWNPDAILRNHSLTWSVLDPATIAVATGTGPERVTVTFELDEDGLIVAVRAAGRPYVENGHTSLRPWHGRFWDYQAIGGRLLPHQGEVAWVLDAGDFVYWRGRLINWNS